MTLKHWGYCHWNVHSAWSWILVTWKHVMHWWICVVWVGCEVEMCFYGHVWLLLWKAADTLDKWGSLCLFASTDTQQTCQAVVNLWSCYVTACTPKQELHLSLPLVLFTKTKVKGTSVKKKQNNNIMMPCKEKLLQSLSVLKVGL